VFQDELAVGIGQTIGHRNLKDCRRKGEEEKKEKKEGENNILDHDVIIT
jgi:hypothetical protein